MTRIYVSDDGWIFYTRSIPYTSLKEAGLYKVRTDGTERRKINGDDALHVNILGDRLYYRNVSDNKIYRTRRDGAERTMLSQEDAGLLAATDNSLLYTSNGYLYRMDLNGTHVVKIIENRIITFSVLGNSIYYTSFGEGKLYKMGLDGSNVVNITDDSNITGFNITGNYIVYEIFKDGRLNYIK